MNEANGIQNIISIYSNSLIVLSQYDRNSLEFYDLNDKITYEIQFEEALLAIQELKVYLISKNEATMLFGNRKDDSFEGILGNVVQSFDGNYVY
ncbi:MAG: hypothetical protein WAR77_12970, partial [Saprospiraceae bacterium]